MTVGEKIKQIRLEKGMTQKELGEKCGLADSAVRRYELGKANPKLKTLKKIAIGLDVPLTELLEAKEYEITEELLTEQPLLKEQLKEMVLVEFKDDYGEFLEFLFTNGSNEQIAEILSKLITHLKANDTFSVLDVYLAFASNKTELLEAFEKLNQLGKREAVRRIRELTELPRYTQEETDT